MTVMHQNFGDLHSAGKWGMDSRIDAGVAEDLGIPSSPERLLSDLNATSVLAEFSAAAIQARLDKQKARDDARVIDHEAHARSNNLTGPVEYDPAVVSANAAGYAGATEFLQTLPAKK